MANSPKTILGLDVGQSWIGVARASKAARLAEPLKTIKTTDALVELVTLISELEVEQLIVGLPRGLDGQETGQTKWTQQWAEKLKTYVNLPVELIDEALTSHNADHAEAAARILQDWLDSRLTAQSDDGKVL